MPGDALYVMTPTEVAWGYVYGRDHTVPVPPDSRDDPRAAIERVIRSALLRPPCGVAFSGGRDSSLVLAVATHVARRDGLPEPVPITRVFPTKSGTEENDWQHLVIGHLGLREWQRIELDDELDLVGPLAGPRLVEHGVTWPPALHADVPLLEQVGGGSLLDGEGGDETLGATSHRIAPVARLLGSPRPLRWRRVRRALRAVAPAPLRVAHLRHDPSVARQTPWLRPDATAQRLDAVGGVEATTPLSFAASLRDMLCRRDLTTGLHNRRLFARPYGVDVSSPLLHPDVVLAFARQGGRLGPGDRTAVLRALIPDLLPDAVLARTTKAEFSGAYWTTHAQRFIDGWSGEGVDERLVDPVALQRLWRSGDRNVLSSALLQQAWLGAGAEG